MEQLEQIITRIEGLLVEKASVQELIREAYADAKSEGFDVKVLRKVIAIRAMDPNDRAEQQAIMEMYLTALENGGENGGH
jgi:uncharacterized protein (UPF0335 family)